jgi:cytochrome c oxidase cbb3-type subunit 1
MTTAFASDPVSTIAPAPVSTSTVVPASAGTSYPAVERAAVDASARGPVLFFFGNGLLWLMLATVLGLITSIQLAYPSFLADVPFLSYGRIWPAFTNTLCFGWGSLAGLGVTIWLLARLGRVQVKLPGVLITGAVFWQVGLTYGIIGILAGRTTGLEGLEIPTGPAILMLIGYGLIVLWALMLFSFRSQSTPFISVWYLVAALLWFPWSFALAHAARFLPNVTGVMQGLVAAWASQNFLSVWLTAIGLAAAYYLIPKVVNRPVHSYNLAAYGFWSFILFTGLTGAVRLSGGPIPAWVVTLSIAANILLLVQIVTVTTNLVLTMRGQYHMVYHSPTIRFTFFGAIAFTVASCLSLFASLRSVDRIVHFTQFQNAETQLIIYSFFSMVIFGAIYYILPRLVGCEWLSSTMITLHFWGAAYGGGLLAVVLILSGMATGFALADPTVTVRQIIESSSVYLAGAILGWLLIAVGHLIFGLHFLLMLLRIGQPGGEPTLFSPIGEEAHH